MKHRSRLSYTVRTLFGRGLVVFAAVLVLVFVIAAIFAPLLTPYDPYESNILEAL